MIRVWDRITLDLHRTLRGHEGPVNAVGLQSEKVVGLVVSVLRVFPANLFRDTGQCKRRWEDDTMGY